MRRRMKGSKNLKASRDPRDLRGRVENPKQPPKLQVQLYDDHVSLFFNPSALCPFRYRHIDTCRCYRRALTMAATATSSSPPLGYLAPFYHLICSAHPSKRSRLSMARTSSTCYVLFLPTPFTLF
ncbi:hypothetical protein HPP92_017018 [Vanilla planifolia]|uniref:Uncharacterized protein n=1 Tax=Vanilla planifolia TaxID=51239 RepID=A0A835UQM4_VANPL|nr:hypothetical protein HPP92_017018 [Vanilla planifolia]